MKKQYSLMEKLVEEYLIPTEEEMREIRKCLKSHKWYIRNAATAALGNHYSLKNEHLLYQMTFDRDEIVKLTAIETLEMGRTQKTLHRLKELALHKNHLVRGYAVNSFFQVWVNCFSWNERSMAAYLCCMEDLEKREKNLWVRANYDCNRQLAGDRRGMEHLIYILDHYKGDDYHIKSAAVNRLKDIRNIHNQSYINRRLKDIEYNLEGCYLKKDVMEYRKTLEPVKILLLDEDNSGISQLLEYVGNCETEIFFSSAGLRPAKQIRTKVKKLLTEKYGIDIERCQYPSNVANLWRYDYIVPLGVEVNEHDYPFQKIFHKYEKISYFDLTLENAFDMLREIAGILVL